jgi:hypothetical protein
LACAIAAEPTGVLKFGRTRRVDHKRGCRLTSQLNVLFTRVHDTILETKASKTHRNIIERWTPIRHGLTPALLDNLDDLGVTWPPLLLKLASFSTWTSIADRDLRRLSGRRAEVIAELLFIATYLIGCTFSALRYDTNLLHFGLPCSVAPLS